MKVFEKPKLKLSEEEIVFINEYIILVFVLFDLFLIFSIVKKK